MPLYDRKVEHVVESLNRGKDRGIKCCLLIGAGCSVSAGIPLANDFIDNAKKK